MSFLCCLFYVFTVYRALAVRRSSRVSPFLYAIVLTKIDKSNERNIVRIKKSIDMIFKARKVPQLGEPSVAIHEDAGMEKDASLQIILTSSVTREGRELVWELLGREVLLPATSSSSVSS